MLGCCRQSSRLVTYVSHCLVATNQTYHQRPRSSDCQYHRHSLPVGERERGSSDMLPVPGRTKMAAKKMSPTCVAFCQQCISCFAVARLAVPKAVVLIVFPQRKIHAGHGLGPVRALAHQALNNIQLLFATGNQGSHCLMLWQERC